MHLQAFFSHLLAPVLLTMVTIALLRQPASRWGLVDKPGGRKQHEGAVPLIGGVAMAIAYVLTMLMTASFAHGQLHLLMGLTMLVALGMIDDFRDLPAKIKLLWQIMAALLIVTPGADYLYQLGNLFGLGVLELGWLAPLFTVVAIVGLLNAVNMSDGIDGLAGGLVTTSVLWMSVLAIIDGRTEMILELQLLLAVTLGFLAFNLRTPLRDKAAVFMGDAGSMMLGACLAWYAVHLSQTPSPAGTTTPPVVVLWVLGLPVLDTLVLTLRRIRQGRSPFSAGRDHMHHIWTHAGFSIGQTTVFLMSVNLLLGAIGVLGWRAGLPESALAVGYIGVFFFHRALATHAWRASKWLRLHKP